MPRELTEATSISLEALTCKGSENKRALYIDGKRMGDIWVDGERADLARRIVACVNACGPDGEVERAVRMLMAVVDRMAVGSAPALDAGHDLLAKLRG